MDIFLFEGEPALIKFALGFMKLREKDIIKCEGLTQVIPLLKNVKKNEIDEEKLVKYAFQIKFSFTEFEVKHQYKFQRHFHILKNSFNNRK